MQHHAISDPSKIMNLRRKRLNEVRQQEKIMSEQRCNIYRQKLLRLKCEKSYAKAQQHRNNLSTQICQINYEWSESLTQISESHVNAKLSSKQTASQDRENKKSRSGLETLAKEREKEALFILQKKNFEKLKIDAEQQQVTDLKRQFILIDRENAKASAESKKYNEAIANIPVVQVPPILTLQNSTQQSALKVQHRGQIPVAIKIIKHGQRDIDKSSVSSQIDEEIKKTIHRLWTKVMNELQMTKKIRDRDSIAKKLLHRNNSASLLEQGLELLQNEDRIIERLAVPRNIKVISTDTGENKALLTEFENTFNISKEPSNITLNEFSLLLSQNVKNNTRKSINKNIQKPKSPKNKNVVWNFSDVSENNSNTVKPINDNLVMTTENTIPQQSNFPSEDNDQTTLISEIQNNGIPWKLSSKIYSNDNGSSQESSTSENIGKREIVSPTLASTDKDVMVQSLLSSLGIANEDISKSSSASNSYHSSYELRVNENLSRNTSSRNEILDSKDVVNEIINDLNLNVKDIRNKSTTVTHYMREMAQYLPSEDNDIHSSSRPPESQQRIDDTNRDSISEFRFKNEDFYSTSPSSSYRKDLSPRLQSDIPLTEQSIESFLGPTILYPKNEETYNNAERQHQSSYKESSVDSIQHLNPKSRLEFALTEQSLESFIKVRPLEYENNPLDSNFDDNINESDISFNSIISDNSIRKQHDKDVQGRIIFR